jgi:serine/threonine-protein kinase
MDAGHVVSGKYRLNRLLGTGGMASVWAATNLFTDREVAIKVMHPQVAATPEAAQRLLKEAKVSARVDHPNIIDIVDVGQAEGGSLFLVMELLSGWSLDCALRRQTPTMTVAELVRIMIEVARALAAAHKAGVVHRDLKPTNIFVHRDKANAQQIKLLDFGVSKFLEDEQNHALTIAGTVLGSPLYMSPEQARGDTRIDGRTDVFAFGAILFEALCGFRAYEAPNFNGLIIAIATKPPKSIDEHAPDAPEPLRAIIRECMVVDRDARATSFAEIADRLEAMLPELMSCTLHLPRPPDAVRSADPEATAAMPRASDRPPPLATSGAAPLGASGSYGSPWGTPQPSQVSISAPPRPSRALPWLLGLAGMSIACVAIFAYAMVGRIPTPKPVAASSIGTATATSIASTTAAAVPSASSSADLPIVSVESLPLAGAKGSPARGSGRLNVGAAPGWCNVYVDGVPRGPTPIASLDLPPGQHVVRCDPPKGRAKTTNVTVQEGAVSKFKFSLDEE